MGKKAKRYTPEFRRQMVKLHRTGRSYAELSELRAGRFDTGSGTDNSTAPDCRL